MKTIRVKFLDETTKDFLSPSDSPSEEFLHDIEDKHGKRKHTHIVKSEEESNDENVLLYEEVEVDHQFH